MTFFDRERAILYDSMMDPIGQQIEVTRLIIHKAIYQRLDNLRNSAWPYCWLNKAVATLLGSNITSEVNFFYIHVLFVANM